MGLFGPLLLLLGVVGDLLSSLSKLFCGVGSLHRLESFSGFLIHLCLQSCVLWLLLQCFQRLVTLVVFLLKLLVSVFRFFGKLIGELFTSSGHILGLSDLVVAHERLGRLGFGQLSLPLLVFFKVVLVDELIEVWVHRSELLLSFLNLFDQLVGFLLERLLRSVRIGRLCLPRCV